MELSQRVARFAALGDPMRLAMADDLAVSDRSPAELGERHRLQSNLLAHHLGVLERAGLISRTRSSGDGRRRYVHLRHEALRELRVESPVSEAPVLFVCTHNSARSQLAAALWSERTGGAALSAGTHPAGRVHPGAVAAAQRARLDLSGAVPRRLDQVDAGSAQVVTVCDRAHEEMAPDCARWHWSIPDPVDSPDPEAFDIVLARVSDRVDALTNKHPRQTGFEP